LSSSLEHGLSVLVELLHRHMNEGLDDVTKLEDLPTLLKIIVSVLEPLHNLVKYDASQKAEEQKDTLPKVLGFQRLKILEFFSALTHTHFLCIDLELMRLNITSSCVRIFFAYPWNNFLHAIVEQMIQVILDCDNEPLKMTLVKDCKLVDLICEASVVNEEESSRPKGVRRGYMGHITAISSSLLIASANSPSLESYLTAHEDWNKYTRGALQATRERESNTLLYAPSSAEYTNEGEAVEEYDNDNGELQYGSNEYEYREDFISGEQEFKLEDDDDEEGVTVQSRIDDVGEWEEREIQDTYEDQQFTEVDEEPNGEEHSEENTKS